MHRNRVAQGIAGLLALFGFGLVAYACATIMHGTTQDVSIASNPSGATVTINNQETGKTPFVATLSRKKEHTIRIEMDGYEPFEITLVRKLSGWVWGNIVFGGLVGLAVDAITGGLYDLRPEEVVAELLKKEAAAEVQEDRLVILVTLKPKRTWRKIGQLIPETN